MRDAQILRMLQSTSPQARRDGVRHLFRHRLGAALPAEIRRVLAELFDADDTLRPEIRPLVLGLPSAEFAPLLLAMLRTGSAVDRHAALEAIEPWLMSDALDRSELCRLVDASRKASEAWTRFLAAAQSARLLGGGHEAWAEAASAVVDSDAGPWQRGIRAQVEEFLLTRGEDPTPLNRELVRLGGRPLDPPARSDAAKGTGRTLGTREPPH